VSFNHEITGAPDWIVSPSVDGNPIAYHHDPAIYKRLLL
jgi:hypothetical protein